jgi:tetratricopeptide (TPR) repeat protein
MLAEWQAPRKPWIFARGPAENARASPLEVAMSAPRTALSRVLAMAALVALACTAAPEPAPRESLEAIPPGAPPLLRLGNHHFAISSEVPLAQRYFDQGLAEVYAFNHAKAIRDFAFAAQQDPSCAICSWGVALAHGPNINLPMGADEARAAWAALQEARAREKHASPLERDLIEALAKRYAADAPAERAALDRAYADAMIALRERYPEHVDVAVLAAEAIMDTMPWNYWDEQLRPRELTPKAVEFLEWALAREPDHLGANHYWIHVQELPAPAKAEAAADRLLPLAPDAGHLVHMPSHIYYRVGRYQDAVAANVSGAKSDEALFALCGRGSYPVYSALYYPHNIHFITVSAASQGDGASAIAEARRLAASAQDEVEAFPPAEDFLTLPVLMMVRFGKWEALLAEPAPPPQRVYLGGIWHYGRGMALVRLGRAAEARAELEAVRDAAVDPRSAKLMANGNTTNVAALLDLASDQLEAELAAASGDTSEAIELLEGAVQAQDAIVYTEPPPWYMPTRQALGAVLLQAGRAAEAEAVYRKDLEQYPKNGWSLYGLAQALEAQGKVSEAAWVKEGFAQAWKHADVALSASRF